MTTNTHGRKISGLKKASGATQDYGHFSGHYVEIFYDRSTGEVWTREQYSLGQNTWTEYADRAIVKICNTSCHMTMQQIADAINDRMAELEYYAQFN